MGQRIFLQQTRTQAQNRLEKVIFYEPKSYFTVNQNLNPSLSLGHKTYYPRLKARGLRPEPKTEPS